jgi:hypothetical protein
MEGSLCARGVGSNLDSADVWSFLILNKFRYSVVNQDTQSYGLCVSNAVRLAVDENLRRASAFVAQLPVSSSLVCIHDDLEYASDARNLREYDLVRWREVQIDARSFVSSHTPSS